jgi:hypothetical protein
MNRRGRLGLFNFCVEVGRTVGLPSIRRPAMGFELILPFLRPIEPLVIATTELLKDSLWSRLAR